MDAIPRFTDSDISALKVAKDALHEIDCITVTCTVCPLYLNEKGCICNYLGYLARKAEKETS